MRSTKAEEELKLSKLSIDLDSSVTSLGSTLAGIEARVKADIEHGCQNNMLAINNRIRELTIE